MKFYKPLIACLAGVVCAGCAKFPVNGTTDARHVTFRFRVAGQIRPDYVYIVAIRTSTDLNPDTINGPIPVITYPNANGFVAGQPTHFILYDPTLARPFIIRRFLPTTDPGNPVDLTKWTDVGVPINYGDVGAGTRELTFEITLDQIADNHAAALLLRTLQVNILTMNRVSTGTGTGRIIDSLGDNRTVNGINQFIKIPLNSSRIYDNQFFNLLEPPSDAPSSIDCLDPDLDLTDFSVEVTTP